MKFALPNNIVALIFSTSGSFCTATGLILMKIANIKVEKTKSKWAILQIEWIMGLVFMALSQTLNACKYFSFFIFNTSETFEYFEPSLS